MGAHLQPLHREHFLQAAVGGRLEALIGSVAPFLPCARLQQKTVEIFFREKQPTWESGFWGERQERAPYIHLDGQQTWGSFVCAFSVECVGKCHARGGGKNKNTPSSMHVRCFSPLVCEVIITSVSVQGESQYQTNERARAFGRLGIRIKGHWGALITCGARASKIETLCVSRVYKHTKNHIVDFFMDFVMKLQQGGASKQLDLGGEWVLRHWLSFHLMGCAPCCHFRAMQIYIYAFITREVAAASGRFWVQVMSKVRPS